MKLDELTLFLEENGFSKNNNKTIQIDKNHIINLAFKKGPLYFQYYLVARKIKFGVNAEDVLIRSSLHFGLESAKDQEAFFEECTKIINSIDLILSLTDSAICPMRFEFKYINGAFIYKYHKANISYFLHFDENREGYNQELGFAFYSSAIHKNDRE